jgi:hypothetical protein
MYEYAHTRGVCAILKVHTYCFSFASNKYNGAANGLINLVGTAKPASAESQWKAYVTRSGSACRVKDLHLGGFARAGSVTPRTTHTNAKPKSQQRLVPMTQHLNEDHKAVTSHDCRNRWNLAMLIKLTVTPMASALTQHSRCDCIVKFIVHK